MSLNDTPRGERMHIAVFGRRNAGKSSVINALGGQETSIVSPVSGTTTDPVYQPMELLPVGPVVLIDTAGLDDSGSLGEQRIRKTNQVLSKTDLALLVIDAVQGVSEFEHNLLQNLSFKKIPVILLLNKVDLLEEHGNGEEHTVVAAKAKVEDQLHLKPMLFSALRNTGITDLKAAIVRELPRDEDRFRLVGDLLNPGDLAVLVVPIDKAAPKGRLILPQQQTIRDIMECDAVAVVTKEQELGHTLKTLGRKPNVVITDSQAFLKVQADTPKDIPLTSFSILFARYKGIFLSLCAGFALLVVCRTETGCSLRKPARITGNPMILLP